MTTHNLHELMDAGLQIPRFYERYRLRSLLRRVRRRVSRPESPVRALRVETAVPTAEPARAAPLELATARPTPGRPPRPRESAPSEPEATSPTCNCGFTVGHHFIRSHSEFTGGAWILIMLGVNPPPRAVRLQCAHCRVVLRRITDAQQIRQMQW